MVIKRVGGKSKLANWIKFHTPPHKIFVDVFGGSGAVLDAVLRPGKDARYVYNDLDNKLYSFFKVLQGRALEFAELVKLTPYSRRFFDEALEIIQDKDKLESLDMLDQALAFLIVNRQSFGAKMMPPWSITRDGEINYDTWSKLSNLILRVHERWRSVFLENLDYRKILQKWDDESTVFYLDAPYEGVESDYYDVNKEDGFDHNEMCGRLKCIKGSYVVSYYEDSEVVDLYKQAGCEVVTQNVKMHLAGSETKSSKTEILLVSANEWAKKQQGQKAIKGRQTGDIFQ